MKALKYIRKELEQNAVVISRSILVVLVLVLGAVIAMDIHVRTASAGPGQPFGGLVTFVFTCTCSSNFAIYFNDLTDSPPITLPLVYQPGATITYPNGPPLSEGRWMLGTWQSGGVCTYFVGKSCSTLQTAGTMYMVGTSE